MAKIILGKRPDSFKKTIRITMLDGSDGTIEVFYKYRTRAEFGAFIDGIVKAGEEAQAESGETTASLKRVMDKTKEANTDYIMQVVNSWNLEAEFCRDSVLQLCDEVPAAVTSIIDTYRTAVTEGRLLN